MKTSPARFALRIIGVLVTTLGFVVVGADAQTPCLANWPSTGPALEFDRTLGLAKRKPLNISGVVRNGWSALQSCSDWAVTPDTLSLFQWSPMPVTVVVEHNSAFPRSYQDGLRWAGRGLSGSATGGAALHWGPVTAALMPVLSYQQNEQYAILRVPTPELSPFGSYFHTGAIDLPQRFGASSFVWAHAGQSFIRVESFDVMAGFSTENMRWGPARKNPILLSAAGPGFPHVFVGTAAPIDLRLIDFDVQAMWGRLSESRYFDSLSINNSVMFAGIVATVTPKNSGLTVGIARAYQRTLPPGGLSVTEQIFGPYTGIRDNPQDSVQGDNQLLSAFVTWTLPDAGFEAYGEYAREDHWEDANDLLMQPDHSRGYTIGFEKVFLRRDGQDLLRIAGEATNLGNAPTWQTGRSGGAFYVHNQIRQGYTHRGQLLGAPIGPGSDAQYISADYITATTLLGVNYSRVRYDNDSYYRHFGQQFSNRGHDTEWALGARAGRTTGRFQAVLDLAYNPRHNRGFVNLVNRGEFDRDNNVSITLGASWLPPVVRTAQ